MAIPQFSYTSIGRFNMVSGVYPGSFDPITEGHYDIIKRCSKLFQQVTVLVMINPDKNYMFNLEERIELVKQQCKDLQNVKVCGYQGILVEYMRANNENIIIKGIRNYSDYEYEQSMACINKSINESVETLVMFSKPLFMHISSSTVKQMAFLGLPVSQYVCNVVEDAIKNKVKSKEK